MPSPEKVKGNVKMCLAKTFARYETLDYIDRKIEERVAFHSTTSDETDCFWIQHSGDGEGEKLIA